MAFFIFPFVSSPAQWRDRRRPPYTTRERERQNENRNQKCKDKKKIITGNDGSVIRSSGIIK